MNQQQSNIQHFDILIVGAGISGIGAACHLQSRCPQKSYAILESRSQLGGTWDLYRFPGIRSDSDMYTLGYRFKPWTGAKAIADGNSILEYLQETVDEYSLEEKIRFGHHVVSAAWSSDEACWIVEVLKVSTDEHMQIRCNFLHMCSGYYKYDEGYTPDFKGTESFEGRIVHPQQWPVDLDYDDQQVVIIGSGATAVTLVPSMAKEAAHVTMLQRSPSYVASLPAEDKLANLMRNWLPVRMAYFLTRWKNIIRQMMLFRTSQRRPEKFKQAIIHLVQQELGPDYDVETHFTPSYNPWTQRLCLVPDSDMFKAIKDGSASVVTDHIEAFTQKGIQLKSGKVLPADLIVTATGFNLSFLSDIRITVDGKTLDPSASMTYKGMMVSDVPNLSFSMGYTNASWTLRADLTSAYLCRLLNHMERKGYAFCCPRNKDPELEKLPYLDFSSGYIRRSLDKLPRQGSRHPWRLYQNYLTDIRHFRFDSLEDDVMEFVRQNQ